MQDHHTAGSDNDANNQKSQPNGADRSSKHHNEFPDDFLRPIIVRYGGHKGYPDDIITIDSPLIALKRIKCAYEQCGHIAKNLLSGDDYIRVLRWIAYRQVRDSARATTGDNQSEKTGQRNSAKGDQQNETTTNQRTSDANQSKTHHQRSGSASDESRTTEQDSTPDDSPEVETTETWSSKQRYSSGPSAPSPIDVALRQVDREREAAAQAAAQGAARTAARSNPAAKFPDESYLEAVTELWVGVMTLSALGILLCQGGDVFHSIYLLFRLTLGPLLGQPAGDILHGQLPSFFEVLPILFYGIPIIGYGVVPAVMVADHRIEQGKSNSAASGSATSASDPASSANRSSSAPDPATAHGNGSTSSSNVYEPGRGTLLHPNTLHSPLDVCHAWVGVLSVLKMSRIGTKRWNIIVANQDSFIYAEMLFEDVYGGPSQPLTLPRQIYLTVNFTKTDSGTDIAIDYEMMSPLNKSKCEKFIQDTTTQMASCVGL